ncbi:MAG: aminotransferase class I/II-fold pyridoxal phosphate-dependent enzyme [Thermoplasmata archaeon]
MTSSVGFPLADWIDAHAHLPHNLGISGMVGELASVPRALRTRPTADPSTLRREIARLHGVAPERVFLTHGATEGNALALSFLAFDARRRSGRAPRTASVRPEYPSLGDVAAVVGCRPARATERPDVAYFSHPNNPTGQFLPLTTVTTMIGRARRTLVDEVFREFSGRRSVAHRSDLPGVWVTGSFTKAFGADDLRVGFVLPCEDDVEAFERHHGLLLDRLPPPSVSGARALLASRSLVLGEARRIFRSNLTYLRGRRPDVPRLDAPVWFDRTGEREGGDRLATRAAGLGVLVCPGSMFGDPRGVRVCLTRRSFPADLEAYLAVRARIVGDDRSKVTAPR